MSDLVVKLSELEASQSDLQKIIDEFEHASDRTDANSGIWSNGHVEDAMHSFATNWKDHREKLLKKMNEAHQDTGKTIKAWEDGDAKIAQSLSSHQTSRGPGKE